jgi:drug/metabolite transporter (DMT)-like permease
VEPQAFNAMRMIVASVAFLAVIAGVRPFARRIERGPDGGNRVLDIFHTPVRVTPREWLGLAALGVVGHALYQYFFIGGLARTSVANSSLMLATTPVVITVLSAALSRRADALAGRVGLADRHLPGRGKRRPDRRRQSHR